MKRFRRLLFNVITAVSLLLSVAVAGLWVRSYWIYDVVGFPLVKPQHFATLSEARGGVQLTVNVGDSNEPVHQFGIESHSLNELESILPQSTTTHMMLHPPFFAWYYFDGSHSGIKMRFYMFNLPHWLFLTFFALWLVFPVQQWSRLRRYVRLNRCLTCGYDLRATPDRCPECGTVPQKM